MCLQVKKLVRNKSSPHSQEKLGKPLEEPPSPVIGGLCLSQFQLGTSPPPGKPRGLAQKTCPGGQDLTFESCLGAGNSTRPGFCGKWKWNFKKIAWIKFLQVKTKTSWFLTFSEVEVFSQRNFSWSMGQLFGSAITHTLQKIWGVAPGLFIFEVFTGLWLSTHTFVQKVVIMLNVLSVYWFY